MGVYDPRARVLWDNAVVGDGATLTADGDSGEPTIDLTEVTDLALTVSVGDVAGDAASLTVQVDMQDVFGNWIAGVVAASAITDTGASAAYGGMHTSDVVLTGTARVSWTVSAGATFSSVQISLIGR